MTSKIEEWTDETEYCDTPCHGPVIPRTRWQLIYGALAFDLWMAMPYRLATSRFGLWLLAHAGAHAHTCTCPEKVLK